MTTIDRETQPPTTAARSSVTLIGSFVVSAIVNYAFGLAMAWLLHPQAYGVLGVAQTALVIITLIVGAGLPQMVVRVVSSSEQPFPITTRRIVKTAVAANF